MQVMRTLFCGIAKRRDSEMTTYREQRGRRDGDDDLPGIVERVPQ